MTGPKIPRAAIVGLIIGVTGGIVANYGDYAPPDFTQGFLAGRSQSFDRSYQVAFYAHIVAGPTTLLAALALMSGRLRRRWPAAHRRLGRVTAAVVITGVAGGAGR